MTLALIPETDVLVGKWLREHEAIIALDANVAGKLPDAITKPWIRVTLLDNLNAGASRIDHLLDGMLQLDCYAGIVSTRAGEGQGEASTLARTAWAVLAAMQGTVADGVVVTDVQRVSGPTHDTDTDLEPARERYLLTVSVMVHIA
jgi:hypothetical protein